MPSAGSLSELTQQTAERLEKQLRAEVGRVLLRSDDVDVTRANLVVRDLLPDEDLNSPSNNGWTEGDANWEQDWSGGSSTTADAYNDAYHIDPNNRAENKVIGFLAFKQRTTNPDTRQIKFVKGADADQGVKDEVQVEGLETDSESTAYFADFIIYSVGEEGYVQHWVDSVSNTETAVYEGAVAESTGTNLSSPKVPELLERGGTGGGGGATGNARADGGDVLRTDPSRKVA